MTTNDWITVAIAIFGGIAIGIIGSRIVLAVVGAPKRPEPIRQAAPALASLALWAGIIAGLLVTLGVISPEALDQLPRDVIAFLPRLLSAAIIVIAANVLASFAVAGLAPALGRLPAGVQRRVLSTVRFAIIALAALLAIRQVGFDTTVINLGVAAIFFGVAGSLMLLISLGGRHVAAEVASTRAVRRLVQTGDLVRIDDLGGRVVAVHPTAIELDTADGRTLLVPSSRFLDRVITIERPDPDRGPRVPD